jgi:acetyltransferase-like isoleucine patch superfamily enzyme
MTLALILYDILLYIMITIIYGGAFSLTYYFSTFLLLNLSNNLFLFVIPTIIVFFIISLIFMIFITRLLLPKIKEGHYDAPDSKMFYIWTMHLTLNRILFIQPIKNIILYSVNLRYLAFKALGGNIAYGCSMSADIDLVDISMISIGKNCVIGSGTMMSCHFINRDKITIGKINISNDVNIGGFSHIAPNVSIGEKSWIGAESKISPLVRIGKNCVIEPLSLLNPGTRVSDNSKYPM